MKKHKDNYNMPFSQLNDYGMPFPKLMEKLDEFMTTPEYKKSVNSFF